MQKHLDCPETKRYSGNWEFGNAGVKGVWNLKNLVFYQPKFVPLQNLINSQNDSFRTKFFPLYVCILIPWHTAWSKNIFYFAFYTNMVLNIYDIIALIV